MAEKELFHEESVRIPMIVYDPDSAADATRGMKDDRLIEAIDLVPTFVDAAGGEVAEHILEGCSLLPILRGEDVKDWRQYTISESEFAPRFDLKETGIKASEARATMVRTDRWKYIHYEAFRPELFDLDNDPHEFNDLGEDPEYEDVRKQMREYMFESLRRRKFRTTLPDNPLELKAENALSRAEKRPVYIGVW